MLVGTDLTYNGVYLQNVLTRTFDQHPVRDGSGTDKLYDRFIISVEATINEDVITAANQFHGTTGAGVASTDAQSIFRNVRVYLSQDRCDLLYTMDGVTILNVTSGAVGVGGAAVDRNNGPKYLDLQLVKTSPKTITILFTLEVCVLLCESSGSIGPVLNNRWSVVDDTDENWRVSRTIRGKLRTSHITNDPNAFRGWVVPSIQLGWKRKRMEFVVSPDGLELGYTVHDQLMIGEVAPWPATSMRYTYRQTLGVNGATYFADMNVRLDGPRGAKASQLALRAMQILNVKLELDASKNDPTYKRIVQNLSIAQMGGEDQNSIDASARVLIVGKPVQSSNGVSGTLSGGALFGNIGITSIARRLDASDGTGGTALPDYNPDAGIGPAIGIYPYGGLAGAFSCYLQSPCNSVHANPGTAMGPGKPAKEKPAESKTISETPIVGDEIETLVTVGNPPDVLSVGFSQAQEVAVYTHAEIESVLQRESNRLDLPLAKAISDNSADDVAVITLSRPRTRRLLKASFERYGAWPLIIAPQDFVDQNGVKHRLLHWEPNLRPPEYNSDGIRLFAADVTYLYSLSKSPGSGDSLPVGSLPWDDSTALQNRFPSVAMVVPGDAKGLG